MLRSITFIRTVHTFIFVIMSAVLGLLFCEVVFDRVTLFSWIAMIVFMLEGLVLTVNGWRCPLTVYAERLGSAHGRVTDIFLPKWFADRVFQIYGSLFVVAMLFFIFRLLS